MLGITCSRFHVYLLKKFGIRLKKYHSTIFSVKFAKEKHKIQVFVHKFAEMSFFREKINLFNDVFYKLLFLTTENRYNGSWNNYNCEM